MVSKEADGALCSNGAYITLDQYFLVISSLKSSSNVPPKGTTRENTVTGGLCMIPCLSLIFFKICTLSKDTRINFKILLTSYEYIEQV